MKKPKVELIAEIKKLGFKKKVSRLWTYSREKLERILNELLKGTNQ